MKKTTYIMTLLLAASLAFGKTSTVLKLESAAEADRVKTINAEKKFEGGKLQLIFSPETYSLAYMEIPRKDIEYWDGKMISASKLINVTLPENVWTGYEKLLFDYTNPGKADFEMSVWIIDHTGYMSELSFNKLMPQIKTSETKDIDYKQMGEVKVRLKAGKGSASIDLGKEIFTMDKERVIDISDIRAIAFAVGGKECKTGISNIRLEGSSETAGSLPMYPYTVFCKKFPEKGYHDKHANLCPWCGEAIEDAEPVSEKSILKTPEGAKKIFAAADGMVLPVGLGTGEAKTLRNNYNGSKFTGLYHFDMSGVNTTTYVDFALDSTVPQDFKKAELKLLAFYTVERPKITEGVKLWSVPEKYSINEKKLTWISQPPVEELLAVSGAYALDNTQVPTKQWFVFDITDYVKKAVKNKQSRLVFKLQGWTTINLWKKQDCGYISFCRRTDVNERRRPHILIE